LNSFENESTEGQRTSAGLDSSSTESIVSGENRTVSTTDSSTEPVSVDAEGSIPADAEPVQDSTSPANVLDVSISGKTIGAEKIASNGSEDKDEQSSLENGNVSVAAHNVEVAQNEYDLERADDILVDESSTEDEETAVRGWRALSRTQIWTGVAFWAVILLGVALRFWGLGTRPLHHDESLHAYFSMILLRDNVDNWRACFTSAAVSCYRYDPLTHGPFQFHIIALVYQISAWLGAPDHGINTTTVRIAAATFGSVMVALPYFLRDYLGKMGAWLACLLLAASPGLVYYSRFAREDIYMACFTVLTVVATARYVRDRKMGWLVTAALAFTLAYATKESTFLVIGLFGSFLGALLVWELGVRWVPWHRRAVPNAAEHDPEESDPAHGALEETPLATVAVQEGRRRFWPRTAAPWLVLCYFVVMGLLAKWVLGLAGNLSRYITASTVNTNHANVVVGQLKQTTQVILPWLGILLVILVVYLLIRDQFRMPPEGRHGLAKRIDPKQQPLLDTIVTMPWTHWFFAVVLSWFLFMLLFTVLFTNIATGIGDGIWQGLYYWLQQQNVARGGQPWYYYLLLIPLYEQIGVVFGLAGVVYVLFRPTRLRLFLAYWFLGNLVIYTWAGEKMPWLMIHITIPMLILAAIALQPAASVLWQVLAQRFSRSSKSVATAETQVAVAGDQPEAQVVHTSSARRLHPSLLVSSLIVLGALLLLAPTLQNMYQVSYVHAADAPHEMMIYVQTSTDINTVMDKIQAIDQKLYHGTHTVPIGVTNDTTWPFAWYLRDYTNVCYQYPTGCQATASTYPIILGSGGELLSMQQQYAQTYQYHQYHLRTQWDQGYMPPPCVKSATNDCSTPQPYVGVGPGLWLSYGDNPPKGATFNLWRAASNIWQWWWERKPFGAVDGSYDMGLFISNQAASSAGVKP
jgi:TIGR03663 family protein